MKALSIKQPWASLIAHGIKNIENRTWKTKFRGRIYIHASAKEVGCLSEVLNENQFSKVCEIWNSDYFPTRPKSAIIGEVDIIDCVINHPSIWAEKSLVTPDIADNKYFNNPYQKDVSFNDKLFNKDYIAFENSKPIYNWVLANAVLYEKPILNVKGKLSFWEPDIDINECIGCSGKFNLTEMLEDSAGELYCKECEEILFPIMRKDYQEMVEKGEIEPNDY